MTYRTLLKSSSIALATGCSVLLAAGCGSDEEPVVQAPVAKPKPKVVETIVEDTGPTPIADLMAEFNIDPRISMTEDKAPDNDEERIVVLRFFDGMVRGDSDRLSSMMSEADALILERMVASGDWAAATSGIEAIEIETDRGRGIGECALAMVTVGSDFDVQLWNFEVVGDAEADDGATFDALATPPSMINRLSGNDWIATWLEIIDQEMARAEEPDEAVEFESLVLESEEAEAASKSKGGSRPAGPGRKKPTVPVFDPNPGFGAPGKGPGSK